MSLQVEEKRALVSSTSAQNAHSAFFSAACGSSGRNTSHKPGDATASVSLKTPLTLHKPKSGLHEKSRKVAFGARIETVARFILASRCLPESFTDRMGCNHGTQEDFLLSPRLRFPTSSRFASLRCFFCSLASHFTIIASLFSACHQTSSADPECSCMAYFQSPHSCLSSTRFL